MSRTHHTRVGDTEPLQLVITARDLDHLDNLTSAVIYMRLEGASTNHVDGVALTVVDSDLKLVEFDPVGAKSGGGNAFDEPGRYTGYVLCTFTDGNTSRHPAKHDLIMNVRLNYEG